MQEANALFIAALDAHEVAQAVRADDSFHDVLLDASGNGEIRSVLARVMPKVRRLEFAQFSTLAGRKSAQQHQAIISACRRGKAPAVAQLVEANWLSLGRLVVESLAEMQGS